MTDDDGYYMITPRRRGRTEGRNRSYSQVDGRNFEIGRPNDGRANINDDELSDNDDDEEDLEDIVLESPIVWHNFALIGDVRKPIAELLNKFNIAPCSECGQMGDLIKETPIPNCEWNEAFQCEGDWIRFSAEYRRQLKFISIIPRFTPREYGKGRKLYFVHVRYDQYFLAEKEPTVTKCLNIEGYYGFLGNKPTHVPVSVESDAVDENKTNFMRIMKIVEGKMKQDKFQEDIEEDRKFPDRRNYYDPLSKEDLEKYKRNIFKCVLHLEDSFSGFGKILDEKYLDRKIYLHNRRNCYQAFNHDIVNIMVFPSEKKPIGKSTGDTWSGKVISVEKSEIQPVNKIFLCKLMFGQANYMVPICGTIPTIEVDNKEAEDRVKNSSQNLIDGLHDVSGIENLIQTRVKPEYRKSFADKYFITLKALNGDLTTTVDRIQYVDSFRCDFIFLVLYRHWSCDRRFPFGEVVGLYTPDASFSKTFPLIAVSCNLSVVSIEEEQQLEDQIKVLRKETKKNRPNPKNITPNTKKYVFSLKLPNQPFNEVAYSYEDIDETHFKLGIHVVNVERYVKPGEFLDNIAKKQFFTFLLPIHGDLLNNGKPLYLISEKITTDILSIKKERLIDVFSFYFSVEKTECLVDVKAEVKREHLALTEEFDVTMVDDIIASQQKPYLNDIVKTSIKQRIKRNKNHKIPHGWFYPDYSFRTNVASFLIVEEMDHLANSTVKELMLQANFDYPVSVDESIMHHTQHTAWMDLVKKNVCLELFPTLNRWSVTNPGSTTKKPIRFSGQFLENIVREQKTNLLKCDMLFPDVSFYFYKLDHIVSWNSLLPHSEAGPSPFTVSITKPLSCFNDVLLQRLMAICVDKKNTIYTNENIWDLCTTHQVSRAIFDKYWEITRSYDIKNKFRNASFVLDCVFEDVTEDSIVFEHPFLRDVSHRNYVFFEYLGLSDVKLPSQSGVLEPELEWTTKIFIYNETPSARLHDLPFKLTDIYSYETTTWRDKLISMNLSDEDRLKLNSIISQTNYPWNMTSESSRNMDTKLKLLFSLKEKQILRIQFSYDYSLGIMKIVPEIFIVNPHLRACLCHRNDPFKYFIHPNQLAKINYQRFMDLYEYKEQFRVLNRIEGIDQTISGRASYFVHNVNITWIGSKSSTSDMIDVSALDDVFGVVVLDHAWCEERFIKLGHKNLRIKDPVNTLNKSVQYCHMEFLACIQSYIDDKRVYWLGHAQVSEVAYIKDRNKKAVHLTLKLSHSNFPLKPALDQLYSLEIMEIPITARILDRSLRKLKTNSFEEKIIMDRITDDVFEYRVRIDYEEEVKAFMKYKYKLNDAQDRALKIAINKEFSLIWGPPGTGKTMVGCIIAFAFNKINKRSSPNDKATVLYCGPSNQSVDVVAEKLMKTFGEHCPKLLRIYSSDVVNVDFPFPGAYCNHETVATPEALKSIALHHIIRLEQKPFCEKFKKYMKYFKENEFRSNGNDRKEYYKKVLKYQNTLKKAYKAEAADGEYEIVLCTAVSSCRKFLEEFSFTQVIIDEAGMCSEAEAIGPFLDRKNLRNTLFIGDHKQLRPIITSEAAKGKQLNNSLFERIYDPNRGYCTMLDTQYRMHPSICEFPSTYFYKEDNARLITALCQSWSGIPDSCIVDRNAFNGLQYKGLNPNYKTCLERNNITIADELWTGKRLNNFQCYPRELGAFNSPPIKEKILFINTEGCESNQTVSGATGRIKSKGNKDEVKAVERLYEYLIKKIKRKDLASGSILVITQYKLQESLLKTSCKNILDKYKIPGPPRVSTVVTSQGSECDYVIFSTVRSLPHRKDIDINPSPGWIAKYLGFITDKNQFNVAITRAKKGLFIIGNKYLLSVNQNWKKLIDDLESRRCMATNIFDLALK